MTAARVQSASTSTVNWKSSFIRAAGEGERKSTCVCVCEDAATATAAFARM